MWMDGEIQSKPINELFYKQHRLRIFIYMLSAIPSRTAEAREDGDYRSAAKRL